MTGRHDLQLDWRVYADATCAGLAALIPVPFVDLAVETVFRRRMPGAIARARGVAVAPRALGLLGRRADGLLSVRGCLLLPLWLLLVVAKRLWRKLLYFLAVKDAADQLSAYWHRAALLDHVIRSGHVAPGAEIDGSVGLVNEVLAAADTSALKGVARQLVVGAGHVPRLLRRARRGRAVDATPAQEEFLRGQWQEVASSLERVVARYEEMRAAAAGPNHAASAH